MISNNRFDSLDLNPFPPRGAQVIHNSSPLSWAALSSSNHVSHTAIPALYSNLGFYEVVAGSTIPALDYQLSMKGSLETMHIYNPAQLILSKW